jgi:3,4-dihydroxy 2-butanone 4-phosphate synthase/GTP cyclohydrolase II
MNDDGTMARLPDLMAFGQRHGLKIATISDLIAYRRKHDSIVRLIAESTVESDFGGTFGLRLYGTTAGPAEEHAALVRGDLSGGGPVLVRVHAFSTLSDALGAGAHRSRHASIERAMRAIAAEGRGVLVLIREVWPSAVSEALRLDRPGASGPGDDTRLLEIGIGSQILHDLGVREMVLLTNSPARKVVGLEGYGLSIVGQKRLD